MRLALIVSLVAGVGCSEDPPGGPSIDSHVEYYDLPGTIVPELDVLIVLDHTTAMAPYQSAVASLPAGTQAGLFDADGTQPDTRIALTTTDGTGTLRQPTTTTDAFLALPYDVHYIRSTNFTGTLTDALAQLLGVGASSSATVQPLAAAKAALDAHPELLRPNAMLGIVTITASDDASAGAINDYATSMKARKPDPTRVALSSAYVAPAARLDAFHAQFPNRAQAVDIASGDVAGAIANFAYYIRTVLGVACWHEPADVDAATAGSQYECDFNAYYADDTTEPVRQCRIDRTGPCFEFIADPLNCTEPGFARFSLRGFPTRYSPPVRGQCVVTGQQTLCFPRQHSIDFANKVGAFRRGTKK